VAALVAAWVAALVAVLASPVVNAAAAAWEAGAWQGGPVVAIVLAGLQKTHGLRSRQK